MALDLSKYNFFNRLDARGRIFFLFAAVVGLIVIVYMGTRLLSGTSKTTGPSRVASAPQGLQNVPGSTLNPEYQRVLMQSNVQAAQQAQMTGGSAVPTLINYNMQATSQAGCVVCSDQSVNVKNDLDDWVRQGKVAPDVSQTLQDLANKNVPIEEYADYLNRLVKEGKLTPEQARQLLEQYKKQHANSLVAESAKTMDDMIKSGSLPIDAANQLLDLQKKGVSASEYAAALQNMTREGKVSPDVAQQLLAQYSQQRAREITNQSIAILHQMAREGQMTPDVEKALVDLEGRMVPVELFDTSLKEYITNGKLTPAVANKILDEYKSQKDKIGTTGTLNQMLKEAEEAAFAELKDLLKQGKITQAVADQIAAMIQKNVSLPEFTATIAQLVEQKKLTPDIAKLKIADYRIVRGLRDEVTRLGALQGNNASPGAYADELKRAVAAGILTPSQAKQLMQGYLALSSRAPIGGVPPGNVEFAQLQQRAQQAAAGAEVTTSENFEAAQAAAEEESAQDRQARIESMINAMAGQAQTLVAAWQPPAMEHKEGTPPETKREAEAAGGKGAATAGAQGASTTGTRAGEIAPLIKAGTIIFAVLDTAVNSDYPDSPVMATVVEGRFKGAKLLGKLAITKSVSGQMDRVTLTFTRMDTAEWIKSKTVNAFAIDPDTARTVMASTVDYHYPKRFGAMMATSFLQGYSQAILNEGTSTTGIFGTSTQNPKLSPASKIAVGLGQIGQTLGQATQNYINTPPTVRVDSGVGLGILFTDDVAQ